MGPLFMHTIQVFKSRAAVPWKCFHDCSSHRKFHFPDPGSLCRVRMKEVVEGGPVKADAGWTGWVKRGTTAAPQLNQHPNSVRRDGGRTLAGLERLPADLCRSLGGVSTRPSTLPDPLLQ